VGFAEHLDARHDALGDLLRIHIRQTIQDKDGGVEFGHKPDYLGLHSPVAGKAEVDNLAIKRPSQHRNMRHASARRPDPVRD
jgi:hypothetical protein